MTVLQIYDLFRQSNNYLTKPKHLRRGLTISIIIIINLITKNKSLLLLFLLLLLKTLLSFLITLYAYIKETAKRKRIIKKEYKRNTL